MSTRRSDSARRTNLLFSVHGIKAEVRHGAFRALVVASRVEKNKVMLNVTQKPQLRNNLVQMFLDMFLVSREKRVYL